MSIPDRWLDYKPIGERIDGTPFIAFKVPLSAELNQHLQDGNAQFTIPQLLQEVPNLGMVIDLTYTYRYYKPDVFHNAGIKYKKLMIPGKQVPEPRYVTQFANFVKEFMDDDMNEGKLIGVHCTHGVNRTGFLICNHMVTFFNMQPEKAMKAFEQARGHRIERENYRNKLTSLTFPADIRKSPIEDEQWRRQLIPALYSDYHSSLQYQPSQIANKDSFRAQHVYKPKENHRISTHYQRPDRIQARRESNDRDHRNSRHVHNNDTRQSYDRSRQQREEPPSHSRRPDRPRRELSSYYSSRNQDYTKSRHASFSRREPIAVIDSSSRYSVMANAYGHNSPSTDRYRRERL